MSNLASYYQARADEYEAIYAKPERQEDLSRLRTWLAGECRDRCILEAACGTGYWTAVAAHTARTILATDVNDAPIEIAQAKSLGAHVSFVRADAFALPALSGCDLVMAHFWWSHVAIADQARFLAHVATRLPAGGTLLMIDNRFVVGSSTPISRVDEAGNTYQQRRLKDGTVYEVLKNFPVRARLERELSAVAASVRLLELPYFWAVAADIG